MIVFRQVNRKEKIVVIVGSGASLEGFNFKSIEGMAYTIGINNAVQYCRCHAFHTQDVGALDDGRIDSLAFSGDKYIASPPDPHVPSKKNRTQPRTVDPGATYLLRVNKKCLSTDPRELTSGSNSGFSAINLALHMKPKIVFMFGVDLQGGRFYGDNRHMFQKSMDASLKFYDNIDDKRIINCSQISRISSFPKVSPQQGAFLLQKAVSGWDLERILREIQTYPTCETAV